MAEVKKETKEGIMADVVVFDVGGQRFSTTLQTLQRYPESILPAMCRDCHDAVGTGKEIHIDRSAAGFGWIMEIYRGCAMKIAQSIPSDWGLADMEDELNFYQLPAPDQLLPSIHGGLLFRREKKALKDLGDKILADLSAVEGSLCFVQYVGFCVVLDKDKPGTLNALYLGHNNASYQSIEERAQNMSFRPYTGYTGRPPKMENGRCKVHGVTFLLLSINQLGTLKEHLGKFGFSVSQCNDPSGGISVLKVSWQDH